MQAGHTRGPRSFREIVYEQLETDRSGRHGLSVTNWMLVFLILASLVVYTAETEREISADRLRLFAIIDLVILLVFAVEFAARLYAAGYEQRFSGRAGLAAFVREHPLMLVVDFLAFAPELLFLALGLPQASWLRSLRVVRLLKMARYIPAFRLVMDALRACIQELLVALSLLIFIWYIAAVLLYLAEGDVQPEAFGSITRSMWWSVITLTTVGYGDAYPVSVAGKLAAGIVCVIGVCTVALPSGIIAGSFIDKFRERRRRAEQAHPH